MELHHTYAGERHIVCIWETIWLIVDRYLMKWKQQTLSPYQWMAEKIRLPKSTLPGEVKTCSNPVGMNTIFFPLPHFETVSFLFTSWG